MNTLKAALFAAILSISFLGCKTVKEVTSAIDGERRIGIRLQQ